MDVARKRLGEIVLRTTDVAALTRFYREVVGLEPYATLGSTPFLKIADDLEGHPQILAIFAEGIPSNGPGEPSLDVPQARRSSLHHFAFVLSHADFVREIERISALGVEIRSTTFPQLGWRSFYIYDPDGNTVEFVCHDPTVTDA